MQKIEKHLEDREYVGARWIEPGPPVRWSSGTIGKTIVQFACVLLLAGLGCRNKVAEHPRAPDEFINNVEWMKTISLKLPDTLSIGQNSRVRIDTKRRLYVELQPSCYIGVFDSLGHLLAILGRPGLRVGEFVRILDFRVTPDDKLYVMNALNEEISVFEFERGWISSFSTGVKNIMTFDVWREQLLVFRRDLGTASKYHLILSRLGPAGVSQESMGGYVPCGKESIRTQMLLSQAMATNPEGVTIFAFMAARSIYVLQSDRHLSEIELENSYYRVSQTDILREKYRSEKVHGFIEEVFRNSRVMSLGFITPQDLLVSFATGRSDSTKFLVQFYCLLTEREYSRAYSMHAPLFYLGNFLFGSWGRLAYDTSGQLRALSEITILQIRRNH